MPDFSEEDRNRLKHLIQELTNNTPKLRFCRDILKDVLERGLVPNALPAAEDAATVLSLVVPLTAAMARLAKHVKATLDAESGVGRRVRR